jgi:hypothetical protein
MIKTLSTVAVLTAVLASPVFAQDEAAPHKPVHALRQQYRGVYNQVTEPAIVTPRTPATGSYFDHESYDPSRIGGRDPSFSPAGN